MKKKMTALVMAGAMCTSLCTNAFAATHTVTAGESMWKIAQKYGVSVNDVIKENPQIKNPNLILVGQQINVPGQENTVETPEISNETPAPAPAEPEPVKDIKADSIAAILGHISGVRATQTPGYEMVEVPEFVAYENDFVKTYIQEFANLTQIPHTTFHTQKMTQYMKDWADARGISCETEEIGNVIMYLPATPGYENAPTVAYQGHIDMVGATADGVTHDWENDPLSLVWTPNSVMANGTSLGADDGCGLAYMLAYIDYEDQFVHGPMRMVFTVDEEVGTVGAHEMDSKYVEDIDYMIGLDGMYGAAFISCAGGTYFDFTHDTDWVEVPDDCVAYTIEFKDLNGGHSASVGGGKANALVALANAILFVQQSGVDVQIASMSGGDAPNAIPKSSRATLIMNKNNVESANTVLNTFAAKFKDSYPLETSYTFTYGSTETAVEKALSVELSTSLVRLMSTVPNNIHTLLSTASGTEASSNLGTFEMNDELVTFRCMARSSSTYQAQQIELANTALSAMSGFEMTTSFANATWPLKDGNKLGEISAAVFKSVTGDDFKQMAIHAGVECGEFAEKNESMYIIATGVFGSAASHTIDESMNFDTVDLSSAFLVKLTESLTKGE